MGKLDKEGMRMGGVVESVGKWFNGNGGSGEKWREIEVERMEEGVIMLEEVSKSYV